jgi:hypothetical protein
MERLSYYEQKVNIFIVYLFLNRERPGEATNSIRDPNKRRNYRTVPKFCKKDPEHILEKSNWVLHHRQSTEDCRRGLLRRCEWRGWNHREEERRHRQFYKRPPPGG